MTLPPGHLRSESISWCSGGASSVSVCAHDFLPCPWAPQKKSLFFNLVCSDFTCKIWERCPESKLSEISRCSVGFILKSLVWDKTLPSHGKQFRGKAPPSSVPFAVLVLKDKGSNVFSISPLRNTLLLCGFLETSAPNELFILSHTQSEKISEQSKLTQCCLSTANTACQHFFLKMFLRALTVNFLPCFVF